MKSTVICAALAASSGVSAFSQSSSFVPRASSSINSSILSATKRSRASFVMYDDARGDSSSDMIWSSLANTERWIKSTMSSTQDYTRKPISYVCETSDTPEDVVAGLFRRLREMREIGAGHGQAEEELRQVQGSSYQPRTYRQTLMVVVPASDELTESFANFDALVEVINTARRNARDYVLDGAWNDDNDHSWVTSVNMSHMHPTFGKYTLDDPEDDASDKASPSAAAKEYMARRLMARRSPYPSLVIEVRSIPPFEMPQEEEPKEAADEDDEIVTARDVKALEALFGQGAAIEQTGDEKAKSPEDLLWEKVAKAKMLEQLTFVTPEVQAQEWIVKNDAQFSSSTTEDAICSFTSYDTREVDAAYEFVFTTIALHAKEHTTPVLRRDYLIMPNFLSKAATSLDKFAAQVQRIVNFIPGSVSDLLTVSTFHPEHVDPTKRSPVPIVVLDWLPATSTPTRM